MRYDGNNKANSLALESVVSKRVLVKLMVSSLVIFFIFSSFLDSCASTSSKDRFIKECITDEIGVLDDASKTGSKLKKFYRRTGVQPLIVLKKYISGLDTPEDMDSYAREYYMRNVPNEDTFLYMYFEGQNPEDEGYMCHVSGLDADDVMTPEVVDWFYFYMKQLWAEEHEDGAVDEILLGAFDKIAEGYTMYYIKYLDDLVVILILLIAIFNFRRALLDMSSELKQQSIINLVTVLGATSKVSYSGVHRETKLRTFSSDSIDLDDRGSSKTDNRYDAP